MKMSHNRKRDLECLNVRSTCCINMLKISRDTVFFFKSKSYSYPPENLYICLQISAFKRSKSSPYVHVLFCLQHVLKTFPLPLSLSFCAPCFNSRASVSYKTRSLSILITANEIMLA